MSSAVALGIVLAVFTSSGGTPRSSSVLVAGQPSVGTSASAFPSPSNVSTSDAVALPNPASVATTTLPSSSATVSMAPNTTPPASASDRCAQPGPYEGSCVQDIEATATGPTTVTTGQTFVITIHTTWSAEQPAQLVNQSSERWCWTRIGGDDGTDPRACDNPDRKVLGDQPGCTVTEAPRPAAPGDAIAELNMSFDKPGKYTVFFSPGTSCNQYWSGVYPGGFGYITVTDPAS